MKPHAGRDNEATAIVSIASKEVSGKPEFKNVIAIRVQYLTRSDLSGGDKVIDAIEFRKDTTRAFEFHGQSHANQT